MRRLKVLILSKLLKLSFTHSCCNEAFGHVGEDCWALIDWECLVVVDEAHRVSDVCMAPIQCLLLLAETSPDHYCSSMHTLPATYLHFLWHYKDTFLHKS
jgi:hypothetical protein